MKGFSMSFENYVKAANYCRLASNLKNADRVEMMVGAPNVPYPFTCVVESNDMDKLDNEIVDMKTTQRPKEIGTRNVDMLKKEHQSLLRKDTWEEDIELMRFHSW